MDKLLFNEYTDIIETGNFYFLDEENLAQVILEDGESNADNGKPIVSNGLDSNDNTATAEEQEKSKSDNSNPEQQNKNVEEDKKTREKSKGLLDWFNLQGKKFGMFVKDQMLKLDSRKKDLHEKLDQVPSDYNGEEEFEICSKAEPPAPKITQPSGDDPNLWQKFLGKLRGDTAAYNEEVKKRSGFKTTVKGVGSIMAAKWLIKRFEKCTFDIEANFKEGSFALRKGVNAAGRGAGGNSFAASLAHIVKNVFLAILVLIGGIFKVIKEYLIALGKIFGTILGTVGAAGKTLVTGEMPSSKKE